MTHSWLNSAYDVVLGPAAIRAIVSLPDPSNRKEMADALRTELMNGPNSRSEYKFDSEVQAYFGRTGGGGRVIYTATPLSFDGYTAIHRRLTKEELKRLRHRQRASTAEQGVYVIDILPAESAFSRTVPRAV
jgi:hypothetical protein